MGTMLKGKKLKREILKVFSPLIFIGDKIDQIINKNENEAWFRTIRDELNQKDVVITEKQLEMIRKLKTGQYLSDKMMNTDVKED